MSRQELIRGLRIAGMMAILVAVCAASGLFALSRYALPWLTAEVVRRTGYQFSAQSIDLHLQEGIVLKDVWVGSPEGQQIFKTPRLTIRPRWSELIHHRVLIIEEVSADVADMRIRGQGQISKALDVDVVMAFQPLSKADRTRPSGTIRAKLVRGRGDVTATIKRGPLLASATVQVDVPAKTLTGILTTGPYRWQPDQPHPWDIERANATWQGSFSRWHIQSRVALREGAYLSYRGIIEKTPADPEWRVSWDRILLQLSSATVWQTSRGGQLTVSQDGEIAIPDLDVTDGRGAIHLSAAVTDITLRRLDIQASHILLDPLIAWISPEQNFRGSLDATAHLQGPVTSPAGRLTVTLSSGTADGVSFQSVQAHMRLAPPWIVLDNLALDLPQAGRSVTGSGKIPWHLVQPASPNLPLNVRLEVADIDPRMLVSFAPGVEVESGGHLKIQAAVEGRYPDVTVEGHAEAHVPEIRYSAAGLDMKDLNLELRSRGRDAEVQQGHARLGKGTVTLSGKIQWPKLDITLKADKATFSIPKKLELKTDANIHLGGSLQSPELTGRVQPREGTYTASKPSKKETEKPAAASPPSAIWLALRMDVTADWPHGLWYREGLTKIDTGGDLRLRKDRGSPDVVLQGPLTLVRGTYDAYSRDFTIQSGSLRFTGTPDFDPQLNIQAQYRTKDVQVNLTALGTADHPELTFTSSPPMTQQEILSYLVTGQASAQLGAGTTPEQQSKEVAAGIASTYLTQSLRSSGLDLGLDVIRVTPSQTGTVWTVGRYLNPDLFVSYGQDPKNAASSVVNADYSLSQRWSLATQASSTSDSYMDILFRYPLERRPSKK